MRKTMMQRSCLIGAGVALVVGLGVSTTFAADDKFPSKTIDVVTHAGAGGGTDATTRMMMIRARRTLKTDMRVVNRKGGGGAVAMNYINEQERDGYTIMTITPSHLFTMAMGKAPISIDDMVGIARATDDPQFLMVKKGKYADAKAMIAAGKAGKLKIGGTHVAGIDQVAVSTFAKNAGIKMAYIPYEGGGHIVTSLIGGDIDVGVLNLSEAESQISAGEITPLLVMRKERMKTVPDVTCTGELGIDAYFSTVRGFVTLKGVSAANLAALEKGVVKAMEHSTYQGYLKTVGLGPDSVSGAAEWDAQIKDMYKNGAVSLKELGFIK